MGADAEMEHELTERPLPRGRLPIASGAAESAHRYVLQVGMKRAGQHWSMVNARKLAMPRRVLRLIAHPASSAW